MVFGLLSFFFLNQLAFTIHRFPLAKLSAYDADNLRMLRHVHYFKVIIAFVGLLLSSVSAIWAYKLFQGAQPYGFGVAFAASVILTALYIFLVIALFTFPKRLSVFIIHTGDGCLYL